MAQVFRELQPLTLVRLAKNAKNARERWNICFWRKNAPVEDECLILPSDRKLKTRNEIDVTNYSDQLKILLDAMLTRRLVWMKNSYIRYVSIIR